MPRERNKAAVQTVDHARKALNKVMQAVPTREHLKRYTQEVQNEVGHRGAAILLATTVENALDVAIVKALQLKPSRQEEMFRSGGVFGDFSNKIIMGHALRIYGAETRLNLDIIRSIRNAFAHAKIPISFDTDEVSVMCSFLMLPKVLVVTTGEMAEYPDGFDPTRKERYQIVCNGIAANLLWWHSVQTRNIAEKIKDFAVPDGFLLVTTMPPLP
jgi:hypothetical protein